MGRFIRLSLLVVGAAVGWSCQAAAAPCERLPDLVNSQEDASEALEDCIERTQPLGALALRPGVYRIERSLVIDKPITLSTAGLIGDPRGCAELPAHACATLLLNPQSPRASGKVMPLEVRGDRVTLDHLRVVGSGISAQARARCGTPALRPLGGGIRVSGTDFSLRKSVLRSFACYTAVEVISAAYGPRIENNVIGPNGDHRPGGIWADGVTIHDTADAVVAGNLFIDNTDVQLILGGCRSCRIQNNRFRHSGSFSGASFAELMLHSWPTTSGDFTGSVVTGNDIDCGAWRRCGYGIMIGAEPWYSGRARGGAVTGNRVSNALMALNVDALTGPMEIRSNYVRNSGGRHRSDCGTRDWPAANIAPASVGMIQGDPTDAKEASISTARCLLNREP